MLLFLSFRAKARAGGDAEARNLRGAISLYSELRKSLWSGRGAPVAAIALAALSLVSATACQKRPLPERDTYAGQLYASRCGGQCHVPFDPRSMTPAMWQVQ